MLADKPFGEWNPFRIRQIGDRTWVWLNDKLVVDGAVMENYWDRTKPLPAKGPIMLQTHGGEIRWRNIFVREIGADPPAVRVEKDVSISNRVARESRSLSPAEFEPRKKYQGMVIIHGGGWTGGDKGEAREKNIGTTLASHGYVACRSITPWPRPDRQLFPRISRTANARCGGLARMPPDSSSMPSISGHRRLRGRASHPAIGRERAGSRNRP